MLIVSKYTGVENCPVSSHLSRVFFGPELFWPLQTGWSCWAVHEGEGSKVQVGVECEFSDPKWCGPLSTVGWRNWTGIRDSDSGGPWEPG